MAMGPNKHKQPSFDFDEEEQQESLPLGDVLQHADELAEHEETDEELGHE